MIPKIIHYIWIGNNEYPSQFKHFINLWKEIYPDYNFLFWNNELVENSKIVSDDISKYYYSNYNIALKTDLIRFKILEKFGGIYIDVDNEPLKRMPDEFILKYDFFSAYQPNDEIAIGIMGAQVGEPLVTEYINSSLINIENFIYDDIKKNEIWKMTGPEYFTKFLQSHLNNLKYKFFESKYFYPYWFLESHRRHENFKETCPDAFSVHHWGKSWK